MFRSIINFLFKKSDPSFSAAGSIFLAICGIEGTTISIRVSSAPPEIAMPLNHVRYDEEQKHIKVRVKAENLEEARKTANLLFDAYRLTPEYKDIEEREIHAPARESRRSALAALSNLGRGAQEFPLARNTGTERTGTPARTVNKPPAPISITRVHERYTPDPLPSEPGAVLYRIDSGAILVSPDGVTWQPLINPAASPPSPKPKKEEPKECIREIVICKKKGAKNV